MKKIVITGGRYGYISPSGVYSVKTTESAPFEVDDKEAARLVKLGVAKILGERENRVENEGKTPDKGSTPIDEGNANSGENEGVPVYALNSSVNELRAIAKGVGITFKVGTKKEDMVAALDDYFSADNDEDEDGFDLSAADPVE